MVLVLMGLLAWAFTERRALVMHAFAAAGSGETPPLIDAQDEGPAVRWLDDYFTVERVAHDTYAIGEPRYLQRNFEGFLRDREWFYYGAFYAAQAMWHESDPRQFERWFTSVRNELLRVQASDGSWPRLNELEKFGPAYNTALATLILQLPYGYLPIFQR